MKTMGACVYSQTNTYHLAFRRSSTHVVAPHTFVNYILSAGGGGGVSFMDPSHASGSQSGGHLDDVPAAVTVPAVSQEVRYEEWFMCIARVEG